MLVQGAFVVPAAQCEKEVVPIVAVEYSVHLIQAHNHWNRRCTQYAALEEPLDACLWALRFVLDLLRLYAGLELSRKPARQGTQ